MLQYLLNLFRIKRALEPDKRMPVALGVMDHSFGDGQEHEYDVAAIRRLIGTQAKE